MKRRVVVTGLGAITPIGNSIDSFWNSVKEGKNGIEKIKSFDTTDFKVKVAAEVKNFNAEEYLGKKDAKRLDRFIQFALISAKECIKNSNIDLESVDKEYLSSNFKIEFNEKTQSLFIKKKEVGEKTLSDI